MQATHFGVSTKSRLELTGHLEERHLALLPVTFYLRQLAYDVLFPASEKDSSEQIMRIHKHSIGYGIRIEQLFGGPIVTAKSANRRTRPEALKILSFSVKDSNNPYLLTGLSVKLSISKLQSIR